MWQWVPIGMPYPSAIVQSIIFHPQAHESFSDCLYQLKQCIGYKTQLAEIVVEKIPAVFTTKTYHHYEQVDPREKYVYRCARCSSQAQADANTAINDRDRSADAV